MRVLGTMLLTAVVVVMLGMNVWFVNERLEVKYYQKGVADGRNRVVDQIISQVQKTGRLTVTMPNGKMVVLDRQRPPLPTAPPVPDANSVEKKVDNGK